MAEVRSYREHMILFFVKNKKKTKDQRPKKANVECIANVVVPFSFLLPWQRRRWSNPLLFSLC